jgi:hypothetical protein
MHSMLTDLTPVIAARNLLRANRANASVVELLQNEYALQPEEAQLVLDAAWAMLRYEYPAVSAPAPRQ